MEASPVTVHDPFILPPGPTDARRTGWLFDRSAVLRVTDDDRYLVLDKSRGGHFFRIPFDAIDGVEFRWGPELAAVYTGRHVYVIGLVGDRDLGSDRDEPLTVG